MPTPPRALLLLGLDGATLDVVRPLARAGRLPNLARWMEAGFARPLASTTPPMSFPAWSTLATGLGPGEHGLFDFTQKIDGAYRLRFVNASDRHGETIFERVSRCGGRVLSLGMPATFPPPRVNGLVVPGFDAPVSTGSDAAMTSEPALYRAIAERAGPWMRPDLHESAPHDEAWHERAAGVLLDRIERKTRFALEALHALDMTAERRARAGRAAPVLASIVFAESDTVAHHFWRDFDAASPRHDPQASALRRDAVPAVYERLDAACGRLRAAFGEDAACVVLSDHGAGSASARVVHLNERLRAAGLLRRAGTGQGAGLDGLARSARGLALRVLPQSLVQALFRRARAAAARFESTARFGGMNWPRTLAFSEEANTQPGVWINLRGREAQGCVAAQDYERARRDVIDALLDWKLPGGGPVLAGAWPREEVHRGPFAARAPDVVLELALDAGHGLSLVQTPWGSAGLADVRELAPHEWAGGRGRGMNGVHRPDGLVLGDATAQATLPSLASELARPSLADVAPALLEALGLHDDARALRERDPGGGGGAPASAPRAYSDAESALVAERLRALGYLE